MNTDPITTFATPLSDSAPCGDNLEYDPRMIELDEQYAGEPEHMMGDAFIPATPPDWRKLEKSATTLMSETRDLRLAVIWAIAHLANTGLSGLSQGLGLILHLSAELWDTLWPIPEDGDVQERISALTRLSPPPGSFDADTTVLRLLLDTPLTNSRALGVYSLKDIRQAADGSDTERTIRAALRDTPPDHLQALQQELDTCLEHLHSIRDIYNTHGMGTPDFTMLTDLLKEMQLFLHSAPSPSTPAIDSPTPAAGSQPGAAPGIQQLSNSTPEPSAPPPAPPPLPPTSSPPSPCLTAPAGNPRLGREQAIHLMEQLCTWFEENEPSSPVPYFLRRAIRSVGVNFLDLITDIAPQAQDQIRTILKPHSPAFDRTTAAPSATPSATPSAAPSAAPSATPSATPEPDTSYFSPFG